MIDSTGLRVALADDIPGIFAVRYSVTENTLAPGRISHEECRRQIEETGRGWGIETAGEVKAFAIANSETGNIWALFVEPSSQGIGYGHRLHEEMLAWLSTQRVRTLWLTTGAQTRAASLYERRGWTRTSTNADGEAHFERKNAVSVGHTSTK